MVVVALLALAANFFNPFKMPRPEIVLAAEHVFDIFGFPITNTILATWLTMLVLVIVSLLATRDMKLIPTGLQNLVEMIIETFYNFVESIAGDKARQLFPMVATLFFFILISNWMGLLPGYGSIWIEAHHHGEVVKLPLLRSAATDLNTTLALAVVSVTFTQIFGFRVLGLGFINRYFPVHGIVQALRGPSEGEARRNPMDVLTAILNFFPGMLEIFGELIKLVSFSFRLFGNIFAGEVLLIVMAFLMPYVASLPFMGLELFVGFIQAFIFAVLTLSFSMAAIAHLEEH
jgi:F-type H+-transporting ATPase subunit a